MRKKLPRRAPVIGASTDLRSSREAIRIRWSSAIRPTAWAHESFDSQVSSRRE